MYVVCRYVLVSLVRDFIMYVFSYFAMYYVLFIVCYLLLVMGSFVIYVC